jgi:hypothetical protein
MNTTLNIGVKSPNNGYTQRPVLEFIYDSLSFIQLYLFIEKFSTKKPTIYNNQKRIELYK